MARAIRDPGVPATPQADKRPAELEFALDVIGGHMRGGGRRSDYRSADAMTARRAAANSRFSGRGSKSASPMNGPTETGF